MIAELPWEKFASRRVIQEPTPESSHLPFVIGAMHTEKYAWLGERLRQSCDRFRLPLALFEVPSVHRSISIHGTENVAYTKANFIRFLMERYGKPVWYVDADCVFEQYPEAVFSLLEGQVDFAIFNWLAEEHTEAYFPVRVLLQGENVESGRYYRFGLSMDLHSQDQLICSGMAQFYNNTRAAKALLAMWHGFILENPGYADDQCLDFVYNNYSAEIPELRVRWLDKSYARCAYWIYVKPVINHPEIPHTNQGFARLEMIGDMTRIDMDRIEKRRTQYVFPKNCIIDTREGKLLLTKNNIVHAVVPTPSELWL